MPDERPNESPHESGETGIALGIDTPLGFVGAGRFGTSVAVALHAAGYRVAAVSSRTSESADSFAERVPGCAPLSAAQDVADIADVVFISTSDAAIAPVCEEIAWRPGQAAVHCSGVLPVAVLRAASDAGGRTGGLHVLQTFPNRDSSDLIPGSVAAVDSDDPQLFDWLQKTAYAIGARPFRLRDEHRAAYHASAIMSCGLVAALMGLAAGMWSEMGMSRDEALAALHPLTAATVAGVGRDGLPAAFTGPAVRGDGETVAAHLKAATRDSEDTARAYAAVALAAMPLFAEHPGLSPEAASEIEAQLRSALGLQVTRRTL